VFQAIHYKITAADLQQLTGGIKREDPPPPPQQHQQNQHQQQQIRVPFSLADSSTALMMQDYSSGAMVNRLAAHRAEEDYFRQCSGSGSTCFLASRIRIQ
jgi:hypothetical protein